MQTQRGDNSEFLFIVVDYGLLVLCLSIVSTFSSLIGFPRESLVSSSSLVSSLTSSSMCSYNYSETCDPSEEEYSGDTANNASYRLPSKSTLEVLMMGSGISSLPDPVGETVGKVKTTGHAKKNGDWRKHVVKPREEESPTESDDEPTPLKKVKGKMFVKDTEQTPMPPKGKR